MANREKEVNWNKGKSQLYNGKSQPSYQNPWDFLQSSNNKKSIQKDVEWQCTHQNVSVVNVTKYGIQVKWNYKS